MVWFCLGGQSDMWARFVSGQAPLLLPHSLSSTSLPPVMLPLRPSLLDSRRLQAAPLHYLPPCPSATQLPAECAAAVAGQAATSDPPHLSRPRTVARGQACHGSSTCGSWLCSGETDSCRWTASRSPWGRRSGASTCSILAAAGEPSMGAALPNFDMPIRLVAVVEQPGLPAAKIREGQHCWRGRR
jgi:hypothetical protein